MFHTISTRSEIASLPTVTHSIIPFVRRLSSLALTAMLLLAVLSSLLSTIRVPEYEQYPPRHLEPLTGEPPPCTCFPGAATHAVANG